MLVLSVREFRIKTLHARLLGFALYALVFPVPRLAFSRARDVGYRHRGYIAV